MGNNIKNGIIYCYMFNENKNSYATIGSNIVHEIINLIKADDKKHYLYIPKDGIVKQKDKIAYVIIVEMIGSSQVKIKYLAKVDEYTNDDNGRNLKYGGQKLIEIFKKNSGNNDYYTNFIVNGFYKPQEEIILYQSKQDGENSTNNPLCLSTIKTQRMFRYLIIDGIEDKIKKSKKDDTITKLENEKMDYYKLISIIENESLWEDASNDIKTVTEIINDLKISNYRETTFFNMIGKENDELAFSNMLAYFFSSNLKVFKKFSNEVLDVNVDISNDEKNVPKLKIEREYEHIDIFINDGTKNIIIENKIKSDINGKKENGSSQLSDYVQKIHDGKKGSERKVIDYNQIHCFIFVPNYYSFKNEDNFYTYKKEADNSEYLTVVVNKETKELIKYKVVRYRRIYDFYSNYKNEFDNYFDYFLEAMIKHTKDIDTDIEDRMKARFIKGIEEARKSSSIDSL